MAMARAAGQLKDGFPESPPSHRSSLWDLKATQQLQLDCWATVD